MLQIFILSSCSINNIMEEIEKIESKIYLIRGQRVMLDRDLSVMYGVETSNLNKAVKRNIERFPEDFMFQLTKEEFNLIFQNGISSWGGTRYMPRAFSELGVAMISSVLKSKTAIQVNISIMRAFVRVRQLLQSSPIGELPEIQKQIRELKEDIESLNKDHEVYENNFDEIFNAFGELSAQIIVSKQRLERKPIEGFRTKIYPLPKCKE